MLLLPMRRGREAYGRRLIVKRAMLWDHSTIAKGHDVRQWRSVRIMYIDFGRTRFLLGIALLPSRTDHDPISTQYSTGRITYPTLRHTAAILRLPASKQEQQSQPTQLPAGRRSFPPTHTNTTSQLLLPHDSPSLSTCFSFSGRSPFSNDLHARIFFYGGNETTRSLCFFGILFRRDILSFFDH